MFAISSHVLHTKKNSILMLFGIGISTLGDFIYLVAINILILKMTGSAAAVAGLYIMGPIASILTKFWAGSYVDRMNKRKLMVLTDVFRGFIVAAIPFMNTVWLIYLSLFFLSVLKAFFEPASMTYITSLIPQKDRKQFNSFRSLLTSGAFLVGPAIAGVLLLISSARISIWINAVSFMISAVMVALLPNVDKPDQSQASRIIRLETLKQDWTAVFRYSRSASYVISIFLLAQFFMVVALGMDAQEVVFTQKVLHLSETDFGLLISITGIGSIIGATTVSVFAKKISLRLMMMWGLVMVALGYLIYALSFSFWSVAFGFVILGYFNAFSNTGFMTFFQNNIPLEMMGRISSILGTIVSMFQVIFILLIGFTGELVPLRYSIISGSILMIGISAGLIFMFNRSVHQEYFIEEKELKGGL